MIKKAFKIIIECMALFFLGLALWLVYKEVHTLGITQIIAQLKSISIPFLLLALLFIACDYLAMSGYDFMALSYIGAKLKKLMIFKTAFIAFSVTNTTGHAYMAGGSVRYFFYSKAGLDEFQVLKVIAFESLTFLMGMGVVLDTCLILSHFMHLPELAKYQIWLDLGAVAVSIAFLLYLIFIVVPKRAFRWGKIEIKAPTLGLTLKQMLIGGADIFSASFVFYALMRANMDANYVHVAVIFLLAQLIGISSQVPGGLGVFEATFLYLFQHTPEQKLPLLASLISFRVLYYFLPLGLSCLFMLASWIRHLINPSGTHRPTTHNQQ